ncbi:MAG TPA: glutamyl-tRNA reductase [Anaerolineaceae bacterium]
MPSSNSIQLYCLSVTHHNTPVELRECLNLPAGVLEESLREHPLRTAQFEPLTEMVVLSTCNRLEMYAIVTAAGGPDHDQDPAAGMLLSYMNDALGLPAELARPYLQCRTGIQAAEHLFRVAAGLDSIAVGETQILGQVSRALEAGLETGSARHALSTLFRAAISTGKRVRTETEIGRHPVSISTLAVQLANQASGLAGAAVLVVGAGKIGGKTIQELHRLGAGEVTLANRSLATAQEMVNRAGGTVLPYERLSDGLAEADVVFTSTAAPAPIITHDMVETAAARRPSRPLLLVDLSVPRNVAPDACAVPGVRVLDMDDIQEYARTEWAGGGQDLSRAEAIVREEVDAYEKLLRVIPFIGELHRKVEQIRRQEVEKTVRQLPDLSPAVSQQIEMLSRSLVRKILHEPTMHLRDETDQETLNEYVDALARLFDLSEPLPDRGEAAR